MTLPANRLSNVRRRVMRARIAAPYTDPASRHLHMMANCLSTGNRQYPMLQEEPEYCAGTLYAVLENLWKDRAALAKGRKEGK